MYILKGCDTSSRVATKRFALKPRAVQLLVEFRKTLSRPIQDKIIFKPSNILYKYPNLSDFLHKYSNLKSYSNLSNILFEYTNLKSNSNLSNIFEQVPILLLLMIWGMKLTTKVKYMKVISTLYHLQVMIYICII